MARQSTPNPTVCEIIGLDLRFTIILFPVTEKDEEEFDTDNRPGQVEVQKARHQNRRRGTNEKLVGQRIKNFPPVGDLITCPRQSAVEGIGESGENKKQPAGAVVAVDEEEENNRNGKKTQSGNVVRRYEARRESEHSASQEPIGVMKEGLHALSRPSKALILSRTGGCVMKSRLKPPRSANGLA